MPKVNLIMLIAYILGLFDLAYNLGASEKIEKTVGHIISSVILTFLFFYLRNLFNKFERKEWEKKIDQAKIGVRGTAVTNFGELFEEGAWMKILGMSQDRTYVILEGHTGVKLVMLGAPSNGKPGHHYVLRDGKMFDLHKQTEAIS